MKYSVKPRQKKRNRKSDHLFNGLMRENMAKSRFNLLLNLKR